MIAHMSMTLDLRILYADSFVSFLCVDWFVKRKTDKLIGGTKRLITHAEQVFPELFENTWRTKLENIQEAPKAKDTPKIPDAQGPAPVAPPPPPPPPQFPGQMLAGMPLDAFLAIQAVDAELARHIFDTYEKKAERLAAEKLALEKSAADQLTAEESPAKHLATSVVKVEETLTDSGWDPDYKKR